MMTIYAAGGEKKPFPLLFQQDPSRKKAPSVGLQTSAFFVGVSHAALTTAGVRSGDTSGRLTLQISKVPSESLTSQI